MKRGDTHWQSFESGLWKWRKTGLISVMVMLFPVVSLAGEVTTRRLVNALAEPENWLHYRGDYSGRNHRPLKQIHRENVQDLRVQWVFQTGTGAKFETVPLVVDGIMYLTAPYNNGYALDARTGRVLWRYQRRLPKQQSLCCGPINRGFAILGELLFMATLDSHLVALDSKTGSVVWDVQMEDYGGGYSSTLAPLVVKDKVIVGTSGGEFGARGFLDAYDSKTGKRRWRFWTVPAPGEPASETWSGDSWKTGGAPTWMTGTYDPELDLLYWGVGNPAPDFNGDNRKGDNLYSDSVIALDPDDGELRWHFQFTPHDLHDMDANEVHMLLDLEMGGAKRKVVVQANRNGFYYVLDRETGEFLLAKKFARVTWASGVGPEGRPQVLPDTAPNEKGNYGCPGIAGAANWMAASFNPETGLFYFMAREECSIFFSQEQEFVEGQFFMGSTFQLPADEETWGAVKALDPATGEMKWEFRLYSPAWAGTLSTAGGLVFAGDMEGYLIALDAETGKALWRFQTGTAIFTAPITYMLDGTQYVAIAAGSALYTFALR